MRLINTILENLEVLHTVIVTCNIEYYKLPVMFHNLPIRSFSKDILNLKVTSTLTGKRMDLVLSGLNVLTKDVSDVFKRLYREGFISKE